MTNFLEYSQPLPGGDIHKTWYGFYQYPKSIILTLQICKSICHSSDKPPMCEIPVLGLKF